MNKIDTLKQEITEKWAKRKTLGSYEEFKEFMIEEAKSDKDVFTKLQLSAFYGELTTESETVILLKEIRTESQRQTRILSMMHTTLSRQHRRR